MTAPTRVVIDVEEPTLRARLATEAARAGWVVVSSRDEADIVLAAAGISGGGPLSDRNDFTRPYEALTARERDVLALLSEGLGNREIAERLGITEHTVKFHLSAIFGKLGATTRTDAVRRAAHWRWIEL